MKYPSSADRVYLVQRVVDGLAFAAFTTKSRAEENARNRTRLTDDRFVVKSILLKK